MYKYFEQLLQIRGLTASDVTKATGISSSTLSTWKKRGNVLGADLLLKIAKFLDCTIEDLLGESVSDDENYYINDEAKQYAQFLFENPEHRVLFDASRKVKAEDMKKALQAIGLFIDED